MSKAGAIGHFGNKLELQLATLDFAADVFRREVWQPAAHVSAGMPRLLAICDSWMNYAGRPAFPGGCFIAAVSFEFDSRPGPVHDALAVHMRRWHTQLVADATTAVEAGDLPASTDVEQIAFGLEALAARVTPTRQSTATSVLPSTRRNRCLACSTANDQVVDDDNLLVVTRESERVFVGGQVVGRGLCRARAFE